MKRVALALLLLCACSPEGDRRGLQDGLVDVEIDGTTEVGPLRIAVVWVLRDAEGNKSFVVTYDRAVKFDEVTLRLAPFDRASEASPLENVFYGRAAGFAYRPRVVVYEDVDDSASLDVGVFGDGGVDVVRGADTQPAFAYQLRTPRLLQQLDLESTERFYDATGGRYSPYVAVAGGLGQMNAVAPSTPLTIEVQDSPIPAASVACERRLGGGPALPSTRFVTVDDTLDAAAICATETGCNRGPLESITPPEVIVDDTVVFGATCRRNEQLEVVALHTTQVECVDCVCRTAPRAELYVAARGNTPSWWPCGDTLPYCDSELPLFERDPACD